MTSTFTRSFAFLLLSGLLISPSALRAQPQSTNPPKLPITFLDLGTFSEGMESEEASELRSNIFDTYKVIDTEKSGFTHLQALLDQITDRLTSAIERQGEQYPVYRIQVLASSEETAFIYKYQPGGQKIYRGYVYISSAMLAKLYSGLGTTAEQIQPEQMQSLVKALAGIFAHEFSHPKQDELVKWSWRSAQNQSNQSHGQADEMTTDLMAMRTLKEAQLEPDAVFYGLSLLSDEHAENNTAFAKKVAMAGIATHPTEALRLNVNRAALTNLRMEEGAFKIVPLTYAFEGLKADLIETLRAADETYVFSQNNAAKKNSSEIIEAMRAVVRYLDKASYRMDPEELQKKLLILADTINNPANSISDPVVEEFKAYVRSLKQHDGEIASDMWLFNGHADSSSPANIPVANGRRYQKTIAKMDKLLKHPKVAAWIYDPETVRSFEYSSENHFFALLPVFFGPETIHHHLLTLLAQSKNTTPAEQTMFLLQAMTLCTVSKLGTDLELQIANSILQLVQVSPESGTPFYSYIDSVFDPLQDKKYLKERLLQHQKFFPEAENTLLDAYLQLLNLSLSNSEFYKKIGFPASYKVYRSHYYRNLVAWKADRLQNFPSTGRFYRAKNQEATLALISYPWAGTPAKSLLREIATQYKENSSTALLTFNTYLQFLTANNLLSPENKLKEIRKYLFTEEYTGIRSQTTASASQLRYQFQILSAIDEALVTILLLEQFDRLKSEGVLDPLDHLQKTLGSSFRFLDMGGSIPKFRTAVVRYFSTLYKRGSITRERYENFLEKELFQINPEQRDDRMPLASLDREGAWILWDKFHREKVAPIALLKKFAAAFDVSGIVTSGRLGGFLSNSMEDVQNAQVKVHPDHARFLSQIAGGLESDFFQVLQIPKKERQNTETVANAIQAHFSETKEFLQLVFNADQVEVPIERKKLVHFRDLDSLAELFVRRIPGEALSFEQNFELWYHLTAKRSNRYTDAFYDRYLRAPLLKIEAAKRQGLMETILKHGRLSSERMKTELVELFLSPKLAELKKNRGNLDDKVVYNLTKSISFYSQGNTSRFRDDLLEKIAWQLELNESQVNKFIEPLKTFNYKSMSPDTLNLMSSLTVLTEKLKPTERIDLIRYIQEPKGSLTEVSPSIRTIIENTTSLFDERGYGDPLPDYYEKLEGFIRDASENERLVLIETLVGTNTTGLWYAGQELREKLYEMAGMQKGTDKRTIFEAYLKALPKHEHTITLSYLLASTSGPSSERSELLRILEMFQAPGIKFAQMASILAVFGTEYSEELAKAKNRAKPPTRAEVFRILKARLTAEEYASIRSVKKLLGSGSLKYVVLAEYSNGKRSAIYLRRPFLDETIESTMDIADQWMRFLKEDPNFSSRYDYDYYLKTLRQQLELEVQFKRELELSKMMAERYDSLPSYQGWKFVPVLPDAERRQDDLILHYAAIENTIDFNKLSPEDRKTVSEYIIVSELKMLLDDGIFDADRHMGNYLFDPTKKEIRPVDMGQAYKLKMNRFLSPGDPYQVAQLIYGLSLQDSAKGADWITRTFKTLAIKPLTLDSATENQFRTAVEKILSNKTGPKSDLKSKLLDILAELNRAKIRIPMEYSLGVIKGLMIVLNEDYAKAVDPKFIETQIEEHVKKQMLLGKWYKFKNDVQEECEDWLKPL